MVFKKGNKVVIVKSLGNISDAGKDCYYYKGNIDEMPLKSKGIIMGFEGPTCIKVKVENGKIWYIHPSEIQLAGRIDSFSKLKKFPDSYVFKVASQTPVFLLNERMYILDRTQPAESAGVFQKTQGRKTERDGLVESASLASLEELTYRHHLKEFEEAEEKYLGEVIKKRGEQISGNDKKYRLIDFIVNEVFPHFRGDGSGNPRLEKLLDVEGTSAREQSIPKKKKNTSPETDTFVSKLIKGIEKESFRKDGRKQKRVMRLDSLLGYKSETELDIPKLPQDYNPHSLLGRVLDGRNAAIIDGIVYYLSEADSSQNGQSLIFNGKNYALISPRPVSEVLIRYNFELSKQIRINALRTKLANDQRIQELNSKDNSLRELVRKKEYEEGDFGFIRDEGGWENKEGDSYEGLSYLVTLKVPRHVLKLPDGDIDEFYSEHFYGESGNRSNEIFFCFKPTKVGVRVFVDENNDISYDGPYTSEPYEHPFSNDSEDESGGICLGDYSFEKLEKMERGEAVARLILDAKNTFLSGYMGENTHAVTNLLDYIDKRIYPGEIKRRNLPVTNIKLAKGRDRK